MVADAKPAVVIADTKPVPAPVQAPPSVPAVAQSGLADNSGMPATSPAPSPTMQGPVLERAPSPTTETRVAEAAPPQELPVASTAAPEPVKTASFDLGALVQSIEIPESEQKRTVAPVDLKAIQKTQAKADAAAASAAKDTKTGKPKVEPKAPPQPARVWVQVATGAEAALGGDYRRFAKKSPNFSRARKAGHRYGVNRAVCWSGHFPTRKLQKVGGRLSQGWRKRFRLEQRKWHRRQEAGRQIAAGFVNASGAKRCGHAQPRTLCLQS